MEFIIEIWPYVLSHAYIFLFLGMILGGETFLLPAVYLVTNGTLSFPLVIFFAVLATLISDTVWYAIGRFSPLEKLFLWKIGISTKIFLIFKEHSQKLLFISKFVYGTRTMVQVLSGAIRMPFLKYSIVNLSGIISYLLSIFLVSLLTKETLASLGEISYNEYVSALVFILIIGVLHVCLKKWLGKKFVASSFPLGMNNEQ